MADGPGDASEVGAGAGVSALVLRSRAHIPPRGRREPCCACGASRRSQLDMSLDFVFEGVTLRAVDATGSVRPCVSGARLLLQCRGFTGTLVLERGA